MYLGESPLSSLKKIPTKFVKEFTFLVLFQAPVTARAVVY